MYGAIEFVAVVMVQIIGLSGVIVLAGFAGNKAITMILNYLRLYDALVRFYFEYKRLKKLGQSVKDVYVNPRVYTPKLKEERP